MELPADIELQIVAQQITALFSILSSVARVLLPEGGINGWFLSFICQKVSCEIEIESSQGQHDFEFQDELYTEENLDPKEFQQ